MSDLSKSQNLLSNEAVKHYEAGEEAQRLLKGTSRLEFERTKELLSRYLPPPPAVIYDVGGGSGVYAFWLAEQGYEVHLIDAVPLHIEQARVASKSQSAQLVNIIVGDARQLNQVSNSADAVLLLGPLYHLIERSDRVTALREAHRVLKSEGLIFAAGISRFASTLDGLFSGYLDDPDFVKIVQQDLIDGQHRNPKNHPAYFTTAFLHQPEELKSEVEDAGFYTENILAIEGAGWLLQNFEEHWSNPRCRSRLLESIRWVENEPSILGVSAHILAVGKKAPVFNYGTHKE
ncbi:hypothetical protein RIVM261_047410 [Rivularia sp. IAM M-261]|nr:hypothetical protein CAL7716_088550 [Calothrix sp. PCC 7716]GJD19785.1 hypothetical protein RIVM261_047410 [Rivularia sp. IAM M-261]